LPDTFERPKDIDALAAVEASLALSRGFKVQVIVDAPIDKVRQHVPTALAVLERYGRERTRLLASAEDPDWFAWRLIDVPFAMTVVEPSELREAFGRIGERMQRVAEREEVIR
jgi:predicted DNA-binding transcriptional regulator YafY